MLVMILGKSTLESNTVKCCCNEEMDDRIMDGVAEFVSKFVIKIPLAINSIALNTIIVILIGVK